MHTTSRRFWKGDGTGNDFVLLLDLHGELDLTGEQVRRWCDRAEGIGADGVLRVVLSANQHELDAAGTTFFMDYRNADGSIAETCGNGIRVFTRFLLDHDLIDHGKHLVLTRAGAVWVEVRPGEDISVSMGQARVDSDALLVAVGGRQYPGAVAVRMPNPHAVVFCDCDPVPLDRSPTHEPANVLPNGANYEFVRVIDQGHISMRVYERGVGETLSCGSGACAAAVATAARAGLHAPWTMRVDVPGGILHVRCDADAGIHLQGPAQITGSGTLDMETAGADPHNGVEQASE